MAPLDDKGLKLVAYARNFHILLLQDMQSWQEGKRV